MVDDETLASVVFFLFYEAIDSGCRTWKVHLYGARRLVELKCKQVRENGGLLTPVQAFLVHSVALYVTYFQCRRYV